MPNRLTSIARKLRNETTPAERRLWHRIRREQIAGFKFRRQVVLTGFIVDFACLEARLILEVDGATHSTDAEVARDATRSAALRALGYAILRFTNDDVFREIDGSLETIRLKLGELRPRSKDWRLEGRRDPPSLTLPRKGGGNQAPPCRSRAPPL